MEVTFDKDVAWARDVAAPFTGSERTRTADAAGSADAAEVSADNMTASFWAVVCGDNSAAWSRDPESYRQDAIEDKGRYPLFGDFASSIKPCAFWAESLEPATKVKTKFGPLVVQNEWDSQTPLPSAQALHADLKGSRMLTVLGGEGHGVYPSGNACTDGTVTDYLVTGKLPAKDGTCEATADSNAEARKNQKRDVLPGSPLPERAPDRFWARSHGRLPHARLTRAGPPGGVPPDRASALRAANDDLEHSPSTAARLRAGGTTGHWCGISDVADISTRRPVTAHDKVRIGSITKVFVATVVLQPAAEGRVDLHAQPWVATATHGPLKFAPGTRQEYRGTKVVPGQRPAHQRPARARLPPHGRRQPPGHHHLRPVVLPDRMLPAPFSGQLLPPELLQLMFTSRLTSACWTAPRPATAPACSGPPSTA
jgi:hypothetical protein